MSEDGGQRTLRVGILADPGLPEAAARPIAQGLAGALRRVVDPGCRWDVETLRGALPLTEDGHIPLLEQAAELRARNRWDYVVYLTDLPRSHDGKVMVCESSAEAKTVLVSMPALGAWRVGAAARKLLLGALGSLHGGGGHPPLPRRTPFRASTVQRQGAEDVSYTVVSGWPGRLRLLAGMVRNNRPGRLLSALSTCMAAAAATGAFGIFYTTMWNMADVLPPWRLALISAATVGALGAWLIVHNGLWSRGLGPEASARAGLDNAATIATVALSVGLMHMVLFMVLMAGSLVVIDAGYLEAELGHPVGPLDYARLAWLAASLGTVAGALGSNFDSDEAIREATYSRRDRQRRRLKDSFED
ncbi:hypothetical protein NCCP1664_15110 [Zafaria cholistanensis]|uniref:Uncharacterized protein n=1 Tax=Zafaria cholistanensis TaxID=1682741 RepID=A0A5A7NQJ5_9MICC|nr:hypothetical protein [Zafaria cholistanensis]GER23015.1 hypothetical protein NCCP1664_15110 [Zafaria cholistanensis]